MGDLRIKARKEAETKAIRQAQERQREGFTVFHFDFNPNLTRRNMTLGEAIRYLMRVTGTAATATKCSTPSIAMRDDLADYEKARSLIVSPSSGSLCNAAGQTSGSK